MQKFILSMLLMSICCLSSSLIAQQQEAGVKQSRKLESNKKKPEQEPGFGSIQAFDGVSLSYAYYSPESPKAVLLFYHGSGVNGCAGYPYMAEQLNNNHMIATYLFDIRGHGKSDGVRGATPKTEWIFKDIATAVAHLQNMYPELPIFLGAHSAGAAMLVNYAAWPEHQAPQAYFMVAPMFGKEINIVREREQKSSRPFAKLNKWSLIMHKLSGGLIGGDWEGIRFNYPEQVIKEHGFVPAYTVNMLLAFNPTDPLATLSSMAVPVHIIIADEDELFDPIKLDVALDPVCVHNPSIHITHLSDAKHLTILGDVHDEIGRMIERAL